MESLQFKFSGSVLQLTVVFLPLLPQQYSSTKGWSALFAGLKPCLAATGISQAVYFYLYSAFRQAVVVRMGVGGLQKGRRGEAYRWCYFSTNITATQL